MAEAVLIAAVILAGRIWNLDWSDNENVWIAWGTWAYTAFTLVLAAFAFAAWRESRRTRQDSLLPAVVVVDGVRSNAGWVNLHARNVGAGAAFDVRVRLVLEDAGMNDHDLREWERLRPQLATRLEGDDLNRKVEFSAIEPQGQRLITFVSDSAKQSPRWKYGLAEATFVDAYGRTHVRRSEFEVMPTLG